MTTREQDFKIEEMMGRSTYGVGVAPLLDGTDRVVVRELTKNGEGDPYAVSRIIGAGGCVREATQAERKRAWGER